MALPTVTPPELVEKILAATPEELPNIKSLGRSQGNVDITRYVQTHTEKEVQNYKWWDADTRVRAVALYQIYGNMNKVADILGMPSGTLRRWKSEDWWEDVTKKIRAEKNEEIDAKMTKIIEKAFETVENRLENGDTIIDKTGDERLVPIKLRDAVYTADKLIDKRNLLRGEPTRITENQNVTNRLEQLKEQFKRFVNAKEITSVSEENSKTVDGNRDVASQETQEKVPLSTYQQE